MVQLPNLIDKFIYSCVVDGDIMTSYTPDPNQDNTEEYDEYDFDTSEEVEALLSLVDDDEYDDDGDDD